MNYCKKFPVIFIFFISVFPVASAQITEPVNSNFLIEKGISPRVLDAAASIFMQEGKYSGNIILTVVTNGIEKDYRFKLIYDPDYKDGMDIRMINYNKDFTKKDHKEMLRYIEKNHSLSRMSKHYLYDESTLKFKKKIGDTLIFTYRYLKKDIEPYLKKIIHMKGEIHIINGRLDKVVLTNTKPLKKHITDYKKTVHFERSEIGGYVVSHSHEHYLINKGKHHTVVDVIIETDDYQVTWEEKPVWKDPDILNDFNPEVHDTINVKLGGVLPFLGKSATKLGYQLPRPLGTAGFVYFHNQEMKFTGLEVGFDNSEMVNLENLFILNDSKVIQSSTIYLAKADVWLFPFLNLMAIVGGGVNNIDGQLKINEELRDFINNLPGWLDLPNIPESLPIKTSVTSEIYGGGVTLAGGVGNFNVSLNYQLMFTKIVEAHTTNMVNVITPLFGYMSPFGINFMVGAQGQFYNTKTSGFIDLNDTKGNPHRLNYNVDFEPIQWNGIIGIYKDFNKHWEVAIQGGFGSRTSLTTVFGYRF